MSYDVHHPNGKVERKRPKKTDESTEESKESMSENRSIQQGNHGIAASQDRMEKWGLTEEELGHSPEEETEEESVVAEALAEDPELTIEELWQQAWQNDREESQEAQSKDKKVESIVDNLSNDAWSLESDESKINTEELADAVVAKLKGDTVEELDSSEEATEELTEEPETIPEETLEAAASAFEDRSNSRDGSDAWSDIAAEIRTEELGQSIESDEPEEESDISVELENTLVWEELAEGDREIVSVDGQEAVAMQDSHVAREGTKLAAVDQILYRDQEKGRIIFKDRFA